MSQGESKAEFQAAIHAQTAGALLRLARLDEAESMAAGALADLASLVDETNSNRIIAQTILGRVRLAKGDVVAAERDLAEAFAASERAFPADHPQRAAIGVALGRARLAAGRTEEGVAQIERSFDIYSRWGLAHPDDVAAARAALGAAQPHP